MADFTLEDILTAEEAASCLRLSVNNINTLARRGKITAKKIGKSWRFKKSEIVKWFSDWQLNTFEPNGRAGEIIGDINGKKKKRL